MSANHMVMRAIVRPDYRAEFGRGQLVRSPAVELGLTAILVFDGSVSATVAEESRSLDAPALILVDSGSSLSVESGSVAEVEWLAISLGQGIVDRVAELLGLAGEVVFSRSFAVSDQALELTSRRIVRELSVDRPGRQEIIDMLVTVWATELVREHARVDRTERLERSRVGVVDRRLRRAIEFIHDHHARELSTSEIASAAYLSEFHFARLFKRLTGQTPHAYLAGVRIARARRLLAESDLSIGEVGARVGYSSASHFAKLFREATGLTPTAYREALGRLNEPC
jgi:AraC-like DNA-binding protein